MDRLSEGTRKGRTLRAEVDQNARGADVYLHPFSLATVLQTNEFREKRMLIESILIASVMMNKPKIEVIGDWVVKVPAQQVRVSDKPVNVKEDLEFKIDPPLTVVVHNEEHRQIPMFAPDQRWMAGAMCNNIVSYGITIPGILNPESLVIKPSPTGEPFVAGKDYRADLVWATWGRVEHGAIGEQTPVFLDYSYRTTRVDTIAVDKHGVPHVIKGDESTLCCNIPPVPAGYARLANIFVPAYAVKLSSDLLYPIVETTPMHDPHARHMRNLIPKTMEKLRKGQDLRILAWGDSVTDCAYLPDKSSMWQSMFHSDLKLAYPGSRIEMLTEAWGGRTTSQYLAQPPGDPKNFAEQVIAKHPDLVISEFVNDVCMPQEENLKSYSEIKREFAAAGIEWIIMTPHYDTWQHQPTFADRVEKDVRPHVEWLRQWASANGIALADASKRWDHLASEGIPYAILLTNGINHPNRDGLRLYADALMDIFRR